ncbi:phage tail assembly protein [Actinobacillus equuli]|uniref:phage tail assembly protein n=1 Tax=Actinobacillus equuli TaxID=718 RepID=UPI002442AB34|nr:phage tail assembly protein [Actinobacillus equuli]WGE76074.1 phage tail assembly protein [Actinobacillus equuli subsp. haemolyticus]WGE78055.1 phage tail assembly protein [Actinobacillus equuli subsp. haemolyticus]
MTTVKLKNGIVRGDSRITEITVRKPLTKQLRGVSVIKLTELHADEWALVLPRVTAPKVDKVDFATMPVPDFMKLASAALELMLEDFADEDEDEAEAGK